MKAKTVPPRDQRSFWTAIRDNPEDDTPRLIYADWLEDHDNPTRAELIRVQCALAKLGHDRRKGRKERVKLEPREAALLAENREFWIAPFLAALEGSNPWSRDDDWFTRLQFYRGFLNAHHFGLEAARRLSKAGDAVEPVNQLCVMECGANYRHESVVEVARWEGAGSVTWFSIAWGGDVDITAIVRANRMRNLRHLGVWHGKVTDSGVAELAAWPLAGSLQSIDLKDNRISDEGAVALAESPHLGQLRSLDLHGTIIGERGKSRLSERFGEAARL